MTRHACVVRPWTAGARAGASAVGSWVLVVGFQRRRRPDAVDVLVQVHGRVRVLRVAGRRGQQRPEIREPTYRLVEARGALVHYPTTIMLVLYLP